MPTIVVLGRVKITVYADDHNPPHFHVLSAEGAVLVSLSTLNVLAGRIRARDLTVALEWAGANREVIEDEWNRLNG